MITEGRRTSSNVEDRRGMSRGKMAVGGGIGTIVIALVVLLLGGDPSQVVDTFQQGAVQSENVEVSPGEEAMANFVSVVLAGTEDVWTQIFTQSGMTYR